MDRVRPSYFIPSFQIVLTVVITRASPDCLFTSVLLNERELGLAASSDCLSAVAISAVTQLCQSTEWMNKDVGTGRVVG